MEKIKETKASGKEKAPPQELTAHEKAESTVANVWPKVTLSAGVLAAAGGGLLAAAVLGVGPAALAGAAGYLAYRALKQKPTAEQH